ncbi:hypothetical protein F7725_005062 [Dissostichus mawsoni]|uniref:Ig-like domain-containing protein n=1 Tax=Dissostichus mawsoni TaxID=36200 RepID=A0A7J5XND2_DISMA|nr:hypothetical protein F7725_005062 [Dissostichus mawsoni]
MCFKRCLEWLKEAVTGRKRWCGLLSEKQFDATSQRGTMDPTSLQPSSVILTSLLSCSTNQGVDVLQENRNVSILHRWIFQLNTTMITLILVAFRRRVISEEEDRTIIQSPALPLMEGDNVTLTCRTKMADPPSADFYKDGVSIRNESDGHMTLLHVNRSDEGLYKCRVQGNESAGSRLSVSVLTSLLSCSTNQGGSVILQSPALPVMEGDGVTLTCKTKMADPHSANFFKDGIFIGTESAGHMTLHHVSRSDEGLYKCSVQNEGESPESRLSVSGKPTTTMDPPTSSSSSSTMNAPTTLSSLHLVFRLLRHLVVFCPYCICTYIVVSLYRERATGTDSSVSVAMTPPTHAEQGLDDDYDDVMSAVTTEHQF